MNKKTIKEIKKLIKATDKAWKEFIWCSGFVVSTKKRVINELGKQTGEKLSLEINESSILAKASQFVEKSKFMWSAKGNLQHRMSDFFVAQKILHEQKAKLKEAILSIKETDDAQIIKKLLEPKTEKLQNICEDGKKGLDAFTIEQKHYEGEVAFAFKKYEIYCDKLRFCEQLTEVLDRKLNPSPIVSRPSPDYQKMLDKLKAEFDAKVQELQKEKNKIYDESSALEKKLAREVELLKRSITESKLEKIQEILRKLAGNLKSSKYKALDTLAEEKLSSEYSVLSKKSVDDIKWAIRNCEQIGKNRQSIENAIKEYLKGTGLKAEDLLFWDTDWFKDIQKKAGEIKEYKEELLAKRNAFTNVETEIIRTNHYYDSAIKKLAKKGAQNL